MGRRTAAAVVGAFLVATGCGDDGGSGQGGDDGEDMAVTTAEVAFEDLAELPQPPADADLDETLPFTTHDGDGVLLGPAGGIVRIDGGDDGYEVLDTEGIDPGEEGVVVRWVTDVAALDDTLVAIGHQDELIADVIPTRRPISWLSDDGETWEQADLEGLDAGTDEVRIAGLTVDAAGGGLVAFGEIRTEDGDEPALWRSDDGESWEQVDTPGLEQPGDDRTADIRDLAVAGDRFVALLEVTGQDDEALAVHAAERDGDWEQLEATGLEPLDLPNTDIIPPLAALDDGFALFASVPVDEAEEFGDRRAALFTSEDGTAWEHTELDGPELPAPDNSLALVPTDAGALGITTSRDALVVWHIAR